MTQAVSCWPLTAEEWVCTRFRPCGIRGGQRTTFIGYHPSSSVFAFRHDFILVLYPYSEPGSLVSIVSGYGLGDRAIEVRFPAETKGFFL
jgi:hypothetical protein